MGYGFCHWCRKNPVPLFLYQTNEHVAEWNGSVGLCKRCALGSVYLGLLGLAGLMLLAILVTFVGRLAW